MDVHASYTSVLPVSPSAVPHREQVEASKETEPVYGDVEGVVLERQVCSIVRGVVR